MTRKIVPRDGLLVRCFDGFAGAKVEDESATVSGALPGGVSVLRRGKKTLAGVFVG